VRYSVSGREDAIVGMLTSRDASEIIRAAQLSKLYGARWFGSIEEEGLEMMVLMNASARDPRIYPVSPDLNCCRQYQE
jgi:hypothetical protein